MSYFPHKSRSLRRLRKPTHLVERYCRPPWERQQTHHGRNLREVRLGPLRGEVFTGIGECLGLSFCSTELYVFLSPKVEFQVVLRWNSIISSIRCDWRQVNTTDLCLA